MGAWNLAKANGGITPVLVSISPPAGAIWDITAVTVSMSATSIMYDTLFGPLPQLTNGLVLRRKNGVYKNIAVVYNNGGIWERSTDVFGGERIPSATYSFIATKAFAGQQNSGVAIRLNGDTGDMLQFIVQDNLVDSKFTKFAALARGHVVED